MRANAEVIKQAAKAKTEALYSNKILPEASLIQSHVSESHNEQNMLPSRRISIDTSECFLILK